MDWLNDLLFKDSVAHTILIYSIVVAAGVYLGKVRILGVNLGIAFVLFAGLAVGHFGLRTNHLLIDFIKDFGLILFVFSIGLQVGPGFFASFRKGGLALNLIALTIVFLGAGVTILIHFLSGLDMPVLVGVMSGAVTNTPGLGAAQQTLVQLSGTGDAGSIAEIGLGYAVAYPFGVLGIILTMVLIRKLLHIDVTDELRIYNEELHPAGSIPERVAVQITNRKVIGETIREIIPSINHSFIISRVLHNGEIRPAGSDTVLHENDVVMVVTRKDALAAVTAQLGTLSNMDLSEKTGNIISKQILVTKSEVIGKKLGSLRLRSRYNINITRIYRSGIELVASPGLELQMGDKLTVVGDEGSLEKISGELGNSVRRLDEPNIVPIFLGIMAGVIIGSIPFRIPGIANPLKLGLAGGPLIIAILLSKYGSRLNLVSYTTPSANLMLREIGIVLFLASVGLSSGEKFIPALFSGDGFIWMGCGALITIVPILIMGFTAKLLLRRNYLELCGLLAGSMTDPPALAFANGIARSEAPAVAYATVYPLVMFLRIFVAQLLILLFI